MPKAGNRRAGWRVDDGPAAINLKGVFLQYNASSPR
jgi:hypothetical protein